MCPVDVTNFVAIQVAAANLLKGVDWICNDLEMDKRLGELEGLIYTARQTISDDWRSGREAAAQGLSNPKPSRLEDLA